MAILFMYISGALSSPPRSAMASTASAFGMALAQMVVPSRGSTAMSTSGPSPLAPPAPNVHLAQLGAHGIDGRLVGRLLVPAPAQARRRDGCRLGHTRH